MLALVAACLGGGSIEARAEQAGQPQGDSLIMARRIDQLLAERWQQENVPAAPLSDDSEFLRRIYLDLAGVIPTVSETRAFLACQQPDKRSRLIDQLLRSPAHATHLASTWRNVMLPQGFDAANVNNAIGLQNWLRRQFVENLRYDNMVAEFLVATGSGETGPALYYTSLEMKPEKLAASTARIFLGLQIQCAQCHDHPFDRWTQQDFWGYAAFFARLARPTDDQPATTLQLTDLSRGEVTLPGTETAVAPQYPGGAVSDPQAVGTRRMQLAIWMTSRDNPYLPRAAVNWAWAHMFGRGLVHPVDDLGPHNPPSHPQLMEELSAHFARSGFDLRLLFRTLAHTHAYQLSSRGVEDGLSPQLFARMAVKTLTAEQLYDSLNRCLSRRVEGGVPGQPAGNRLLDRRRLEFVARMQTPSGDATEFQAGLPQALMLMNGPEINQAADVQRSPLLKALEAPFFSDQQRVTILFLATLTRPPADAEREKFLAYVRSGGPTKDRRQALGDVLWALLNSAEFALNH